MSTHAKPESVLGSKLAFLSALLRCSGGRGNNRKALGCFKYQDAQAYVRY